MNSTPREINCTSAPKLGVEQSFAGRFANIEKLVTDSMLSCKRDVVYRQIYYEVAEIAKDFPEEYKNVVVSEGMIL